MRALLDAQHYLRAGRPAGHVLWQGAWERDPESGTDRLVAVFCWAGAAKRLKDRDEWIGWDAVTCANRLKLVVQLRRFVVIEAYRRPNLASQCLGRALRELPAEWHRLHGFTPLLAESFHDPAHNQGALYKVTNWTPLGFTKGFRRHCADFYQDLGSPKQLWIRPLQKNAGALLSVPGELPEAHRAGIAEATCGARCAKAMQAISGSPRSVAGTGRWKTKTTGTKTPRCGAKSAARVASLVKPKTSPCCATRFSCSSSPACTTHPSKPSSTTPTNAPKPSG